MTATLYLHGRHRNLGGEEYAVHIGRHYSPVQLFGDRCDGARTPNARVVNQRIDATETVERGLHHLPRNRWITDITRNGDVVGIIGRLNGTRISNYAPSALFVGFNESLA